MLGSENKSKPGYQRTQGCPLDEWAPERRMIILLRQGFITDGSQKGINRNLRKGQSIASNPLGCCWFYHLQILLSLSCHYYNTDYSYILKVTNGDCSDHIHCSTSVARLIGIFSPVSVGMSTITPHKAYKDDHYDDDYNDGDDDDGDDDDGGDDDSS